jgi:uncharacterized membrane protein
MAVNQYYNVVVVLASLVPHRPYLVQLTLLYRTSIAFNWQTYYWMRVGHKQIKQGILSAHRRQNARMVRLNHLAGAAALAAVALVTLTELGARLGLEVVSHRFAWMFALFLALLTLENCVFPYELFHIYLARGRQGAIFITMEALGGVALFIVLALVVSPYGVVVAVEALYFSLRVLARRLLRASGLLGVNRLEQWDDG